MLDLFYLIAAVVGAPVWLYLLATRPRIRQGLRERLGLRVYPRASERPSIWIHGVSVGEVLAARPLIQALELAFPEYELVVSSTTDTGMQVARQAFTDNHVFRFPLDFGWSVRRVLKAVRPRMVVLVELEIWPNFLRLLAKRDIPVVLVNGRITERSFRGYKRFMTLLAPCFDRVACYGVQGEEYARRFRELGVGAERVVVTGSLKYDTIAPSEGDGAPEAYRTLLGLGADPVWVCGSTHDGEERQLLEVYSALVQRLPRLRLVVAPRHIERAQAVQTLCESMGWPVLRRTQIEGHGPSAEGSVLMPIVLLDTVGELAQLYRVADVVLVGGTLVPHGGQNMLEAAAASKPVVFGPSVDNFADGAAMLLAARAALQVSSSEDLETAVAELLDNPEKALAMGKRGYLALDQAQGATEQTVAMVRVVLSASSAIATS